MPTILVTGGAGYIGSILVPMLLRKGFNVTVLDNFLYNQVSLSDCVSFDNFRVVRGDSRDEELLKKYMKDADYIIPLAAIVGMSACDADRHAAKTINLEAIRSILNLRSKNQKIIFPNTNSGYGIGKQGIYCDEKTPLNPISLYGQAKAQAENIILDSGEAITFRLATVFGISPRMRLDLLVNQFVHEALTKGYVVLFEAHFKRNFIHIQDVARAFIHAIENFEKMKNEPYNVGLSNANLSKKELCEEIKKQIPKFYFVEAEVGEDPDKRNYIVSNAKIESTGFMPVVSLQSGIAELIKGYEIFRVNKFTNL
ncbi:NAD(P)-dependent oxidoreductase [bacterium]|nr:MAG: NAD(P)-dependent oxidoreductase [bacterium]